MRDYFIPCDGIKLHAKLDKPEGKERCPLTIIIHGFTGHMEEPHIVAAAQAMNEAGIAALRVEMYGHGKSEGRFEDHTIYKWVTGALSVVDYARTLDFVTDLYLCGHSQGGLLVMLLAGMKRDDFKAVILLSPAWMIPDETRQGRLLGCNFNPDYIPETLEPWGTKLNGNYIRVAQTIHVEDEIMRYTAPVLIVQGDADDVVPLAYARRAAELYANAKLLIIPGDTHCFDHHPEIMTGAVRDFIIEKY